jgi:hypothetical protein
MLDRNEKGMEIQFLYADYADYCQKEIFTGNFLN